MKNNERVFNTVIVLTITMLLVKTLSAIYRVPYQNVLGDAGLYAYQQVYPVVAIVSVLSLNAVPSVISQQQDKYFPGKLLRLLRVISIVVFVILFTCSDVITSLMGDKQLSGMFRTSLLVLLPFSFIAVVRGRLQAENDMRTIAMSQVIDQVLRVSTILVAVLLFTKGFSIYDSGMLSICGSFLGLSGAWLYLKFGRKLSVTGSGRLTNEEFRRFFILTLFYSLSYLIMILWQLVDSFTVLNGLKQSGIALDDARALKGIYDRGASLIQLGLIVTTSFSLVLIPLLAASRNNKAYDAMNDYARSALKITIIFSSAAAIGLMNLIRPFNLLLFEDTRETGTLSVYMLAIIFVSLIIMYTAMLQVTEDYKVQGIGVLAGLLVKVGLNVILIARFGVFGAAVATVAGLTVYALILHSCIRQRYQLGMQSFMVKWCIVLAAMSIMLQLVCLIPSGTRLSALVVSLIGVALGVMIVAIALIRWRLLTKQEWSYLPLGDKMMDLMKE
ncbi:polysaccharide biosynthesis protein [Macrococcus equipercicus]|uniref:Polysaccharide biosynthesis protein n=1 Tax=Macrococcus equipercicus TaxID=69967 RepID=A0ABQ6R693_9STAP|nr:polysaccharide biosynthesis protein [Macrococcus equipercicus]KAA1036173.1 polysaccharide biosynthesis protein [Macrococcus equipercicus]